MQRIKISETTQPTGRDSSANHTQSLATLVDQTNMRYCYSTAYIIDYLVHYGIILHILKNDCIQIINLVRIFIKIYK
jgi:hypothetical protein